MVDVAGVSVTLGMAHTTRPPARSEGRALASDSRVFGPFRGRVMESVARQDVNTPSEGCTPM